MFQKKSKQLKLSQKKSILDQTLLFLENYLPQKKHRTTKKELHLDSFEAETIKQIQKLASTQFNLLIPKNKNAKVSFTFGRWALPYLKLLKQIGIAK